jgi:hypothetical protein
MQRDKPFLLMTEAGICPGLRLETRFVFPVYLRVTLVARLRRAVTEEWTLARLPIVL